MGLGLAPLSEAARISEVTVRDSYDAAIGTLRDWLRDAKQVVVLTGAGISTDSGIPDFRGPQGIWTKNPGAEKQAYIQNYVSDREVRVRRWRNRIESSGKSPEPNPGHLALAELERRGRLHTLITQNVDGLHLKAGSSAERLVEIHGTTRDVVCLSCGDRAPIERALERVRAGEDDPPCRSCGGILKTAAISFGQGLVQEDLRRAEQAAASSDLMLAIGTTLKVFPIAAVVPIAKQAGARIAIINREPTEMDALANVVIRASISETLQALIAPDA